MTALADRLLPEPLWQRVQPLLPPPGDQGAHGPPWGGVLNPPGPPRWKAERTIAWLAGCRRLRIRYDRESERPLSS